MPQERFEASAMLAADHLAEESAPFFKESIRRPIITERYLRVKLLWLAPPKDDWAVGTYVGFPLNINVNRGRMVSVSVFMGSN